MYSPINIYTTTYTYAMFILHNLLITSIIYIYIYTTMFLFYNLLILNAAL